MRPDTPSLEGMRQLFCSTYRMWRNILDALLAIPITSAGQQAFSFIQGPKDGIGHGTDLMIVACSDRR